MASLPTEAQQLAIRVAQEFVTVRAEIAALGSGGGTWGSITGTISTQTDLAAALAAITPNSTHTGDATGSTALTLATVNAGVGTFGSATAAPVLTINAKGLITAAAAATITPAVGSVTGLGTGVAAALAINIGSAGALGINIETIGIACSDMTTVLTTGEKVAFDIPFSIVLTRVYASLAVAPTVSALTIDVEDEGTSLLNAVLSIGTSNNNAETSTFAAAASTYALTKGDRITIDIDSVGSSNAGLVVFLEGYRT